MSPTFSHTRLLVTDFADCFLFYRDVLDFEPVYGDQDGPYAEFDTGGDTLLALFDRQAMAEAIGQGQLPADVPVQDRSMLVFAVDSVDATHERLIDAGVEPLGAPVDREAWGIRAAHYRDPAGNLLEINEPLESMQ